MARTVDPLRYQVKRLAIIDSALTCFAEEGFDRTTTAAICRRAGIGSGTFFHYFPTKLSVLLAILELGTAETGVWFAQQAGRTDAARVVADYVAHVAADYSDPRIAGFVRAVAAVMAEPDIAAALTKDQDVVHEGLLPWIEVAQAAGDVRSDVPPARLCAWIAVVLDGFLDRITADGTFTATTERDMLADTVRRLLAP